MSVEQRQLHRIVERQRTQILRRFERWFEGPMVLLGFVWLVLLVIELVWGLTQAMQSVGTAIWVLFVVDFAVRFALAPGKAEFLKRNWLTAIALVLPALRVFRIVRVLRVLRAARAARGIRLVRLLTSLNRGMGALGASMHRRGFIYVLALTAVITVAGAGGMYAFEGPPKFGTYADALWWTAMIMTTMGSESWPQTGEGRILCALLSIYAFTVFGYTTASLATFFIGRDAQNQKSEIAGTAHIRTLQTEIRALTEEVRRLADERR